MYWLTQRLRAMLDGTLTRVRLLARRFLIVTLTFIGAVCGVIAVAFERYLEIARDHLIGAAADFSTVFRIALVLLIPAVVFAAIAFVVSRAAPKTVGANLARIRIAYLQNPKVLGFRSIAATFLLTPLSLGAGAPLGPEGPIVVITSGFSAAVVRFLKMPPRVVRAIIPVGVAAGIAAIFNAPITGVVFALEEIAGTADRGLLGGILLGAVAAAVVERVLLGGRALLAAPFSSWYNVRELVGFAIVGIIAGVVSGFMIAGTHLLKRRWTRMMPSMIARVAMAGVVIGCAGLVSPSVLGVGYDSISYWLHGGGDASGTAIAFAVKTIVYVVAVSAGVLGGSFAPSLFIGTAMGASIGHLSHDLFPGAMIDPKAYAIIGMGSFFGGLLRSPMAAILIVVELTRDYELVLPLMLGVSLSIAISRRISKLSIVEQQMLDEGFVEIHDIGDPLSDIRIETAMTSDPLVIAEDATLGEIWRSGRAKDHRMYPVVDNERRLVGIIGRDTLARGMTEEGASVVVRDVAELPKLVAAATDPVLDVIEQMQVHGIDRCPVVDDQFARHVVGFISPSDLLRARIRHTRRTEERAFELFE